MTCPIGTDVDQAAALLRDGGLVAFPTETVYGLGANAWDSEAVARVFDVKNRPRFDPLIVHVAHSDWLDRLTEHVPHEARKLAELFWPGPLSLVLPKAETLGRASGSLGRGTRTPGSGSPSVPDLVTAGLSTVAIRVPDHPLALQLLRAADLPIAAPSANAFGRLSPTRAEHVEEQLGEKIGYILDGGPCRVGVESTVLEITDHQRRLLRPGGLSVEEIEAAVGPVTIPERSSNDESAKPKSPGQLPRHYAPRTPLTVLSRSGIRKNSDDPHGSEVLRLQLPELGTEWTQDNQRLGLLALQPVTDTHQFAVVEVLSPRGDLVEAAAHFFAALRRLDSAGLDRIIALQFPETGLGRALNDRLRRASAHYEEPR